MYADAFYEFINLSGFQWIIAGIVFAIGDYLFNTVMCWLTGGFQGIDLSQTSTEIKQSGIRRFKVVIRKLFIQFIEGGDQRILEFRQDKLSWSWPITVLAIPTIVYGMTRSVVSNTSEKLITLNLFDFNYRIWPFTLFDGWFQYILWLIAFIISMSTFYRYRRQRSTSIWFAKSFIFHLLRTLLFDFMLSYFILNTIVLWLDFSTALYRFLSDDAIIYPILHPDLMYGLKPVYEVVVRVSVILLVSSLLPTLMLIREKKEKYSWMYYPLFVGCLVVVIILGGILIYQFDQRLEANQVNALSEIYDGINTALYKLPVTADTHLQLIAEYQHFSLVSMLPNGFNFPTWFAYVFGARILIIFYEAYLIMVPSDGSKASDLIRRILEKLV